MGAAMLGPDVRIMGVCTLDAPREAHLTFARPDRANPASIAAALQAGAIVVASEPPTAPVPDSTLLIAADPRRAFAIAFRALHPVQESPGIHPTASTAEDAVIPASVHVGAGAWVGSRVVIGEGCVIRPNAVIGGEGFAFTRTSQGMNERMPHIGGLWIGSRVEVGSHATIREGTIEATRIEDGVKIDDHVHIAHNCRIGRDSIITAGATIAGSVHLGEQAWIGVNATIADGVRVGPRTIIGAGAVVLKDCEPDSVYSGNPARRFAAG